MIFKEISYRDAIEFLLPRHYSGRKPQITWAFGWIKDDRLMAVCTFGKPASNSLCKGICGESWSSNVYELNRLCRDGELEEPLSKFVSLCLKELKKYDVIVVSYSDMAMNHHGYIYQACNFIYTGCTKQRTDKYTDGGKHARHYDKDTEQKYRKIRSSKHRYIYFCTNNRKLKKTWAKCLNYNQLPYPKGDNDADYEQGYVLQQQVVSLDGENVTEEQLLETPQTVKRCKKKSMYKKLF